ncbi:MAG: DUF6056 family protein [Bacteroidales bacterium]|jgi:hypothetical protein|nr:DUF6056 family protein [Bacteroidales bacterium]
MKISIKKTTFNLSGEKLLLSAIVITSIIILLPFVIISLYNIPGASDDMHHSFFNSNVNYLHGIWNWYSSGYNGRFANALFMLFPGRPFMNIYFAKIFPISIIVFLIASAYYFFNALSSNKIENLIFSTILVTFFYLFAPSIVQFYWFSGATVYTIPLIFYLLLLGLYVRYFNTKRNIRFFILSTILLFLVIGSHESWAIITFFTTLAFFLNVFFKGEKITKSSQILLVISLILMLSVILGPGTFYRLQGEKTTYESIGLWASVYYSFQYSWSEVLQAIFNLPILFCVFALFFYKNQKNTPCYFSEKLLSPLIVLLLFITFFGCFIVIYSFGNTAFRPRGIMPNYFASIICGLAIVYILKYTLFSTQRTFPKSLSYSFLFLGLFLGAAISTNFKNVITDIFTGRAQKESSEIVWLFNYIKNNNDQVVSVPQVNSTTQTLYWFNVPTAANGWHYFVVKGYFKKGVLLDPTVSIENFIRNHEQQNK